MTRALLRPALIFLLFGLLFHRFFTHTLIARDSLVLYAPLKYLVAQALKQGELWAWDPTQFLGRPFLADPLAGWFYPLNLLYLLIPLDPAHRLFILLHYPLAGLGMDLFLRGQGLPRGPALCGALVFPLSGYMVCQHANAPFLLGPAWTPLALHFFGKALSGKRDRALAAGAILALQALGGDPQSALITAGLLT
jgi:hypothetical protein